jgi:hypothetical protein
MLKFWRVVISQYRTLDMLHQDQSVPEENCASLTYINNAMSLPFGKSRGSSITMQARQDIIRD